MSKLKTKNFAVRTEKGTTFHTPAKDVDEAIERYWDMVDSSVSHIERRCTCFNEKHIPMDRAKYDQPIEVIQY